MVLPPLKYTCIPCFVTGLFKALTHTLVIGYHHVGLWALVVVASVSAHCSFLLGLRSQFGLVQCPFWKFAVFESLVQVFFLLLQFTSVPIEPAVRIIKKLLEEDQTLRQRTSMAVNHIVSLLEFCLRSTYFTFKGRFYE